RWRKTALLECQQPASRSRWQAVRGHDESRQAAPGPQGLSSLGGCAEADFHGTARPTQERRPGSAAHWRSERAEIGLRYTAFMPVYEYMCRACGRQFEYLVLKTSPAAQCPSCQASDLEQLVSLCGMSSDTTKQANLDAAHKKAGAAHKEKQRDEHKHLHEHYD